MKNKKKIQQLKDRLDILLMFVNELFKEKHGVALMWGEDYEYWAATLAEREAHDEVK